MAQDSEQPRIRPEANGHYEHIVPELPQQYEPDDIEQVQQTQQPDPQFSYGASPAPQSQKVSEPPAPLSYDSPEFYSQPQAFSSNSLQAQQIQDSTPQQQVYSEQSPYGYPPPHYETPPVPSYPPYGATSGYGHGTPPAPPTSPQYGGYNSQFGQYGPSGYSGFHRFDFDAEPQSSPLPLGEAVRGLFAQYWQTIAHPSPKLFAREMGKAKWNIVWVQIIGYSIIVALFSLLSAIGFDVNAAANSVVAGADTNGLPASAVGVLQHILVFIYDAGIYGQILITPLTIFIGIGILYLLAKVFGGTGKFVTQLYCSLLFLIPLGVISSFLSLLFSYLPSGGSTLAFLVSIAKLVYEGVLLGYLLIPVHRISSGRATGAVLLLCGVVVLLACVVAFVFSAIFAAALGPA